MSALDPRALAALVDTRTGVVRSLTSQPVPDRLPASYEIVASRLCDSRQFSPWASDSAGAGYAFDDHDAAVAAAVGEAVERYCGNLVPHDLRLLSWTELHDAGEHAVDPRSLALFSPEQHARHGFPWQPFTREVRTDWARGRVLATGQATWVPAILVWPAYALDVSHRPTRGRPLAPVLQAGLATGSGRAQAERNALLEVLERDAMALSWHGRAGLRSLEVDADLAALARGPRTLLDTRFLLFASPFGIPVVGALVRDRSTGYLALGTGCRTDARDAAVKALGEALQLVLLLGEYDDPAGAFAAAAEQPGSPLAPWRADRSYLRAYAPDLSDVRDYGCHLQLALDPAFQAAFEAELADGLRGAAPVPLADVPPGDADGLVAALGRHGMKPVSVDVTTEDVRAAGLHVTRVVVPGTLCNSAAGFPLLGGSRLDAARAGRPRRVLPLPH